MDRRRAVVVLFEPAGPARHVGDDVREQQALEPGGGLLLRVGRVRIDLSLGALNQFGRQADSAVVQPARRGVEVVAIQGQRGEILQHRRIAEAPDLENAGIALEAHDVARDGEKARFRRVNARRAGDAEFAGRARVEIVLDRSIALQIRDLASREFQVTREDRANRRIDRCHCGDERQHRNRATHRLNVTAPAFASRSMYSRTAVSSSGSNSALTASRMSPIVRVPSM